MTPEENKFLKQLVHRVLNSAITATLWRLPTPVLIGIVVVSIAAIWYFKLF